MSNKLRDMLSNQQYMCYDCAGDCFKKGVHRDNKVFCSEKCYQEYLRKENEQSNKD